MDRTVIGEVAARLMGRLEGLYGDDREGMEIEKVFLIVAVGYPGQDHGGTVHFDVGGDTPDYVARGLLAAVDSQLEKRA